MSDNGKDRRQPGEGFRSFLVEELREAYEQDEVFTWKGPIKFDPDIDEKLRQAIEGKLPPKKRTFSYTLPKSHSDAPTDSEAPKLHKPPLVGLRNVSKILFSKKVSDQVFVQLIEDVEEEYYEALEAGENVRARWIRIRGFAIFALTIVLQFKASCFKSIWKFFSS